MGLQKHKFKLTISEKKIKEIFNCNTEKIDPNFQSPLTDKDYKIYIITNESNDVYYIGATKDSIRQRLTLGLNADGSKGYHGYKWKHLNSVFLNVWIFKDYDQDKIENIEAELAFLVRMKTEKWPKHQNEIHFNNKFTEGKEIAMDIYNQLMET
jgi:predicted GIY-YIG superfamily endonuclease